MTIRRSRLGYRFWWMDRMTPRRITLALSTVVIVVVSPVALVVVAMSAMYRAAAETIGGLLDTWRDQREWRP